MKRKLLPVGEETANERDLQEADDKNDDHLNNGPHLHAFVEVFGVSASLSLAQPVVGLIVDDLGELVVDRLRRRLHERERLVGRGGRDQRILFAHLPVDEHDLVRERAELVREAHLVGALDLSRVLETIVLLLLVLVQDLAVRVFHRHIHVVVASGHYLFEILQSIVKFVS